MKIVSFCGKYKYIKLEEHMVCEDLPQITTAVVLLLLSSSMIMSAMIKNPLKALEPEGDLDHRQDLILLLCLSVFPKNL